MAFVCNICGQPFLTLEKRRYHKVQGDSWKLTFFIVLLLSIKKPVKAFIIWKILLISFPFDISIKQAGAELCQAQDSLG